jgi:hypothetical protein
MVDTTETKVANSILALDARAEYLRRGRLSAATRAANLAKALEEHGIPAPPDLAAIEEARRLLKAAPKLLAALEAFSAAFNPAAKEVSDALFKAAMQAHDAIAAAKGGE